MGDVLSDHGLVAFSLFEILAQAEMLANFTRNSPISRSSCMGKWLKIFQCRIFIRLSAL